MKIIYFIMVLFSFSSSFAQAGDELLVYSLKGTATVIENNIESKLKIGKVLKRTTAIRLQPDAKLTMVCKEGKPLSVTKQGLYALTKWKDSCNSSSSSVSSKYFQYIWDQMYVRSEDYKKEHGETTAAVVRGQNPLAGDETMEIYFDPAMDTIYYSSGMFPLSWTTNNNYKGKYYFVLKNSKTGKTVYKDSIIENSVRLDKLKKYMKTGNVYDWSITTSKTSIISGGVIKYIADLSVSKKITAFQKSLDIHEDQGALYFRTAYLLENDHYMADALLYYQKAAGASPDVSFYQDKLADFKLQFNVTKN